MRAHKRPKPKPMRTHPNPKPQYRYAPPPPPKPITHTCTPQVFRAMGALLAPALLLLRLAAVAACSWLGRSRASSPAAAAAAAAPGCPARSPCPPTPACASSCLRPTLWLKCAAVYLSVLLLRVVLYQGHLALQRGLAVFLVSDHVLLAASIVACVQVWPGGARGGAAGRLTRGRGRGRGRGAQGWR